MEKEGIACLLIAMILLTPAFGSNSYGNNGCPPPPQKPTSATTGHGSSSGSGSASGSGSGSGSSANGSKAHKCPVDALKLGACVDLLGGLVHVGVGDPVVNKCCPLLGNLAGLEAALCLCTTINIRLLNLNIMLPLSLELIAQCGLSVPDGFQCPAH